MTVTVRQLIEHLKTLDQDARVEVLKSERSHYPDGDYVTRTDLVIEDHIEYRDYNGCQWAIGTPHEHDRIVFIGAE